MRVNLVNAELDSEPCQTSKMELFAEIVTGAQLGIFRGRRGFLELGHFNKRIMYNIQKGPVGKNFVFFFSKISFKLNFK